MDGSNHDDPKSPSRRALLGGMGVGFGMALAGCATPTSREIDDDGDANDQSRAVDTEAEDRIDALEAELAAVTAENDALKQQVSDLENDLERSRQRLEAANLWGFDQATIEALQQIADEWKESVVVIDAITDDGLWSVGTGWVYDDGVIATNAHVVEPQRLPDDHSITRYHVWDYEGNRSTGDLLGYTYGGDEIFDDREDIGFLEVAGSITAGRRMKYGISRELGPDEPLVQIGHPYSLEFWTAAGGPFIAHEEPFFTSNIPGQPGVSGAPVLDLDGDVIGMTWGGRYTRRQHRQIGDAPQSGDRNVLTAFEKAVNGAHSYMRRIHTAADTLV
ncbi:trypsin-like peptidase domain-containing protein [Natronosalvus vescus]|uniref:trypsin-like peptidase domain-containing protein n=1 Tax=Natronosalvus vescus TaxID=2953881 RepID=UPI0020912475|nr:trypsin-like peptidase domain-containing protein [Natronosalvus vescus]